ncbi:MAG: AAA family ATPase [Ehrlichia sp.]
MDTIIGHTSAKNILMRNPHIQSWLIHGSKGIGKATLAYHFAQHLTQSKNFNCYNPDLLIINDNEEIIGIDKIRNIKNFLYLSTARFKHRVTIIDSIDNLTVNAINAMLKILEEPPSNSTIILISHNLHYVPVVIRSRCFALGLSDLDFAQTQQVLRINFPDLDYEKVSHIYPGTPGMINHNITSEIQLYKDLISIVSNQQDNQIIENTITTDISFYKIEHITLTIMLNVIKETLGIATNLRNNISLMNIITNKNHIDKLLLKTSQIQHLIFSARKFQLDKRSVMLNLVNIMLTILE